MQQSLFPEEKSKFSDGSSCCKKVISLVLEETVMSSPSSHIMLSMQEINNIVE